MPLNQLEGIEYSSKILTEVLDELFEEQFEASESFLFGFSQGSLLTFEFGARYHKVLAGYMAISGYIYDPKKLLEEMNPKVKEAKWLCTHGKNDDVLPFSDSKAQVKVLQNGGLNVEFHAYSKTHTIVEEELEMIVEWINKEL